MAVRRRRILIVLGFLNEQILSGFARYAREANWILNPVSMLHGTVADKWHSDGLLTTNVFRPELRQFIRETAKRIPTVLHGCNDLGVCVPNVECDERAVGQIAAHHLVDQGHRHFAFFQYSSNRHASLRREGFRACLAELGYKCFVLHHPSKNDSETKRWFQRQLMKLPKPLGLFAEDDMIALNVIDSAMEEGWRVPEDLAVIGSGNLPLIGNMSRVPITSIMIPFEEEAYRAAEMLDVLISKNISKKKLKSSTVIFPPGSLVQRQSTNAIAARRPIVVKALLWISSRMSNPAINTSSVAAGIGVSLRLLYKEFKEDLGSTPRLELEKMRLRAAKHLLHISGNKITYISQQCGFENLRTFQRSFQRMEGLSPIQWRKSVVCRVPL